MTKIIEIDKIEGKVDYLVSGCSNSQDHFLIRVGVNEVQEKGEA